MTNALKIDPSKPAELSKKSGTHRRGIWKKLLLLAFGVAIGLILSELVCRMTAPSGPFQHNPIVKKQADRVDLFEYDKELGHRLRGGGFVGVYEPRIVSLTELVQDSRREGRFTVLNLGDSSTSGWDSNIVTENAERVKAGLPLKSPFHRYKTYSDVMAEDEKLYVINAGVPGYSSLQGCVYLEKLLSQFASVGIKIDLVTVYFGNNDSIWNGNIEDKYVVSGGGYQLHLFRLFQQIKSGSHVQPRVVEKDYYNNLLELSAVCRRRDLEVVFIEPLVPRLWPPGVRASGRHEDAEIHASDLAGTKVGELLLASQQLYAQGVSEFENSNVLPALDLLTEAREIDYVVPRIKEGHVKELKAVASESGRRLVSVSDRVPLDDREFFIDYCHPIEPGNRLLVDGLINSHALLGESDGN
jgi:lysophospholipase L1-like esterase